MIKNQSQSKLIKKILKKNLNYTNIKTNLIDIIKDQYSNYLFKNLLFFVIRK